MHTSRRDFVMLTLAAGAAAVLNGPSLARAAVEGKAAKPLKILILGGTGFLGPAVVEAARARGHTLTLFNRGRTAKRKEELFGEKVFPDIEKLYGNRDPQKHATDDDPTSPKGLTALEGDRTWDAVVDTSGYVPRIVSASANLLKDRARHYTFISSVSVYTENGAPGGDESRPVGTMKDPTVEEMGLQFENYGPLKALCEQAAESAFPGRALNIRPGYIVGAGDPTDRFTYWPVRASKGGEMLAPGSADDPIQLIDVHDLGEWIVRCIENNTTGVFNALGPQTGLTIGQVLDACVQASENKPQLTWVPGAFLAQKGAGIGMEIPIWLPPEGETAGFHRWKCEKAVAAGLTFRPVSDTVRDLMAWWKTLPEERTSKLRAGMTPEREAEFLKAWKERAAG
ncbi:MAG: NAD-dependent epimerase/dehydratase family protein [Planctomycetota bacterium]|nr:NAD-dependent epimerase/dehydratase family protein [Planctomycetota bacterium]